MIKELSINNYGKFQDSSTDHGVINKFVDFNFDTNEKVDIQIICWNNWSWKSTVLETIFILMSSKFANSFNRLVWYNHLNLKNSREIDDRVNIKWVLTNGNEIEINKSFMSNLTWQRANPLQDPEWNIDLKRKYLELLDGYNFHYVEPTYIKTLPQKLREIEVYNHSLNTTVFSVEEINTLHDFFNKIWYDIAWIKYNSTNFLQLKSLKEIHYVHEFLKLILENIPLEKPLIDNTFIDYVLVLVQNLNYGDSDILFQSSDLKGFEECIEAFEKLRESFETLNIKLISKEDLVHIYKHLTDKKYHFPKRNYGRDYFTISKRWETIDEKDQIPKKYILSLMLIYQTIKENFDKFSQEDWSIICKDIEFDHTYLFKSLQENFSRYSGQEGYSFKYWANALWLEMILPRLWISQDFILNNHWSQINFSELSSWEQKIINDLIQIRINIEDWKTNVFVIDEPEQSLHPLWQQEYIKQLIYICNTKLEEIDKNNATSIQIFIATHSTFIPTDLEAKKIHKLYSLPNIFGNWYQQDMWSYYKEMWLFNEENNFCKLNERLDNKFESLWVSQSQINAYLFDLAHVSWNNSTKLLRILTERVKSWSQELPFGHNRIETNSSLSLNEFIDKVIQTFQSSNNIAAKHLVYILKKAHGK